MSEIQCTCPDCRLEMQPIRLLDATDTGMGGQGISHTDLSYAAADSVASFFTRTVPRLGTVHARICPECGRIVLYGRPSTGTGGSLGRT
ncbi:MAG: hypothetical protein KJ000_35930 [Pirellulaceae bacterium]|nr:hypothetical protein [Pirellulaceae bacterium]